MHDETIGQDNALSAQDIDIAPSGQKEATVIVSNGVGASSLKLDEEALPNENAQTGVQKIEAVTLAWSKKSLATVLVLIWLLTLTNGFKTSILYSLLPYATSDFQSHSLLTVIDVVANAMTAAVYIPMAKVLDVWGRAEGFLVMLCFCLLGLILFAVSQNLPTFCAAQVFYSVGFGGLNYTWVVIATDVTNLRNRGLAFAFTSSPNFITAFAGSKAAEAFYENSSWRWGFGCFAIILPFVALPIWLLLKLNLRKARMQGIFINESSNQSVLQQISHCIVQFDVPGVVLFAGGLTTFLLPFTLASRAPNGWNTDYIIAMIVVGFVLLVIFAIYQHYWAPAPFLNYRFLTDRTVLGACLLNMTYQISYYCWAMYFSSFLQVVYELSVSEAGYVGNTFSAVSGPLLFLVGWSIRKTGFFKWLLLIAVPLYIFAQGLMIHFRLPGGNIGYIVMCEIFISMAGCVFILCVQLAVLAAVDHQHVAAVLALLFVVGTVGGAIGNAVSGAIWTNTFFPALQRYLPASAQQDLFTIYGSLPAQLSYPVGTPERAAIQEAYAYAQTRMLAAGTSIMVLGFIWVLMVRNINVKKMSQTKGVVF